MKVLLNANPNVSMINIKKRKQDVICLLIFKTYLTT